MIVKSPFLAKNIFVWLYSVFPIYMTFSVLKFLQLIFLKHLCVTKLLFIFHDYENSDISEKLLSLSMVVSFFFFFFFFKNSIFGEGVNVSVGNTRTFQLSYKALGYSVL